MDSTSFVGEYKFDFKASRSKCWCVFSYWIIFHIFMQFSQESIICIYVAVECLDSCSCLGSFVFKLYSGDPVEIRIFYGFISWFRNCIPRKIIFLHSCCFHRTLRSFYHLVPVQLVIYNCAINWHQTYFNTQPSGNLNGIVFRLRIFFQFPSKAVNLICSCAE